MIYFILALLIALGLIFPKSKSVMIIDMLSLGLIIGLRTNSFDYYNYLVEYNIAQTVPTSLADFPGYNIVMRWAQNMGLNFKQFVFVVALISIALLGIGMMRFSKYVPFAISLFIVYPFGHEAIQMRTFLADAMVISALPLLLIDYQTREHNILSKCVFFIIVFLASTIHTLCWFYLVVAVIYLLCRNNKQYILLIISTTVIMILLIRLKIFSGILLSVSSGDKLEHWVQGSTNLGSIIYAFLTILMYLLIRFAVIHTVNGMKNDSAKKIEINILNYSASVLLIIPLLTYDITFNRLWRIFLILLYLVAGEYIYSTKFNKTKFLYMFILLIMVISMSIIENEVAILNSLMG